MTTEAHVISLFERANPVPDPDAIDIAVSADECLATVLHEEHGNVTLIEPTTTGTPTPDRRRLLIPAAAAAVLVIVLVAVLAIFGADETAPSDSVPPTTSATTVPEESAAQPTAADLAVIDAFFTAYNEGDTDAVLAMLAEGAIVTEFDPDEPYADWDQRLAWNLAQGEVLTEPDCTLALEQPAEGTTLFCAYETLDAVVLAVDGEPIPTSTSFTVVDGEFTVIDQRYGVPDFAALATPFTRWMEANHPVVTGALFHQWTSRAEAVEHGRLRAEWAQAWARSLDDPEGEAAVVLEGTPMAPPLPVAADGETQESIVGNLSWTRVDGDASSQPSHVDYELFGEYYGSDDVGRITWRSPDAVSWTKIDPVDPVTDVVKAGGGIWAVQYDRVRDDWVLARSNGTFFAPLELPPSSAPKIDGLSSSGRQLSLAAFGDQLTVVVHEGFLVHWGDFLGAGDWVDTGVNGDGTIQVRDVRNGTSVQLDVIVDETERGRIHLHQDDELIASIGPWPGLDAESLIMSLDGLSHNELMIGDESGFEAVPLPAIDSEVIDVAALGERLLLLGRSGEGASEFELWTGTPGTDWERLAVPAPSGAVVDDVAIASDGRSALLTVASGEHGEVAEAWYTSDGETWRVANGGVLLSDGVVSTIQPTGFGWATYNAFGESDRMTVSRDGVLWQEISVELPQARESSGGRVAAFGDTIIVSQFEDFGDRTMWVGRVETG